MRGLALSAGRCGAGSRDGKRGPRIPARGPPGLHGFATTSPRHPRMAGKVRRRQGVAGPSPPSGPRHGDVDGRRTPGPEGPAEGEPGRHRTASPARDPAGRGMRVPTSVPDPVGRTASGRGPGGHAARRPRRRVQCRPCTSPIGRVSGDGGEGPAGAAAFTLREGSGDGGREPGAADRGRPTRPVRPHTTRTRLPRGRPSVPRGAAARARGGRSRVR